MFWSEAFRSRRTNPGMRLTLASLAAGTMIAATIYGYEWVSDSLTENAIPLPLPADNAPQPAQGQMWGGPGPQPFLSRMEVIRPSTLPAASAGLGDGEEVIGVEAGGYHRAYALSALRNPRFHIVNDLIGGVPLSVAYCNITDCTQVYTSKGDAPLPITQAGRREGEMVIRIGGVDYEHRTGRVIGPSPSAPPLPYELSPWTRTTWGEWKRRHPATDVYSGGAGREAVERPIESRKVPLGHGGSIDAAEDRTTAPTDR
jgi:hypothetical protein